METPTSPTSSHPLPSGAQIRSRITVVCAECKRLKLKCDRRTPCSSCLKRDTVPRCLYSAAAAEKIDVQSLHNRVLLLEAQLAQFSAGGSGANAPSAFNDRSLIATGSSYSSIVISLEDVAGIWLETLGLSQDLLRPVSPIPPAPSFSLSGALPSLDLFRPEDSEGLHPTLTDTVLSLLPPAEAREDLLRQLESIMELHPCFNFPHFRSRVNLMFSSRETGETCEAESIHGAEGSTFLPDPPSPSGTTLSFFSAVCAGFALASRVSDGVRSPMLSPSSHHSHTSPPSAPSHYRALSFTAAKSPQYLWVLSRQALSLHELTASYDLDYIIALILQILFLLYDGMPNLHHSIFPAVGHMVNVARMMGLYMDPDEHPGRYGLFESEMRRRIWWDVYYYDLFVSDCMGHPPLIADDFPTCKLPSDVNEEVFYPTSTSLPPPVEGGPNFAYFLQKCRLAQLVKNVKKRTFRDPFRTSVPPTIDNPSPSNDLSIDAAISFESEVAAWMSDLPPQFKLDMLQEDPTRMISGVSPPLVAQRCEIATITARLVIKLFIPFLKKGIASSSAAHSNITVNGFSHPPPLPPRPPHHAVHACVNAAHAILHASRVAHALFKQRTPGVASTASESLFYSFGRQVFDAAVISAHSVISAPQSLFAKVAMEDLRLALEIMRDPMVSTGRGPMRGGVEGSPSEALKIVEALQAKAETARSGMMAYNAGVKRKHAEVDQGFQPGFHLPYVGSAVVTAAPPLASSSPDKLSRSKHSDSGRSTKDWNGPGSDAGSERSARVNGTMSRDRGNTTATASVARVTHPHIGVRVRSNTNVSTKTQGGRSRAGSVSNRNPPTVIPSNSTHPAAPPSLVTTGGTSSSPQPMSTTHEFPPPPPPASTASSAPPIATNPTPPEYSGMPSSSFNTSDDAHMRYASSSYSHPHPHPPPSQPMYDHYSTSASTSGGPSPSATAGGGATYYMPSTSYPAGGYDTTMASHPPPHAPAHTPHTHVNLPMLSLSNPAHPAHNDHSAMPVDTNIQGSVPSTPRDMRYMPSTSTAPGNASEKPHQPPPQAPQHQQLPHPYKTDGEEDAMIGVNPMNYSMPGASTPQTGWGDSGRYPTPNPPWPQQYYWKDGP